MSHLTEIVIKSNRGTSKFLTFCQEFTLKYWDLRSLTYHKHFLVMNQIKIIGDRSKCYRSGPVGLHIYIAIIVMESLTITITNSLFHSLDHTALTIISQCYGYNKVHIENCTFENNYMLPYEEIDVTLRPLIDVVSAHDNKSISFKQCNFKENFHAAVLISISFKKVRKSCHGPTIHCSSATNISFVACQFSDNEVSELMNIKAIYSTYYIVCKANLLIIGPSHFQNTQSGTYKYKQYGVISISNMVVSIIGPVIISSNLVLNVMHLEYCDITFYNNVTYKSNKCVELIHLKSSYIKVMEHAIITLLKNKYRYGLILSYE